MGKIARKRSPLRTPLIVYFKLFPLGGLLSLKAFTLAVGVFLNLFCALAHCKDDIGGVLEKLSFQKAEKFTLTSGDILGRQAVESVGNNIAAAHLAVAAASFADNLIEVCENDFFHYVSVSTQDSFLRNSRFIGGGYS